MKAKKILFMLAGIFNCIIGGLGVFFGLLIFLFNNILKTVFSSSMEMLNSYVQTIAEQDESYKYLLTSSSDEIIDFFMRIVNIVGVVLLILGLIWVAFGVINLLLTNARRYYRFKGKKFWKVMFLVGSWVLLTLNIANILTTVAVCLKEKEDVSQKFYSATSGQF